MTTRRQLLRQLPVSLLGGVFLTGTILHGDPAPDAGHGKKHGKQKGGKRKAKSREAYYYSSADRRLVYDYYRPSSGAPVYYRNPDPLPPGLQKKLYRTGTLPKGWRKQFVVLDPVLVRRLPPVPAYYDRGFIGGNLVLVNRNTSLVIDVVSLLD